METIRETIKEKQKRQARMGAFIGVGICCFLVIFGATFWLNRPTSVDEFNCPIAGPSAYTAIVIDKSQQFSPNKIQQIKYVMSSWLKGLPENVGEFVDFNRRAFMEGARLELYIMNANANPNEDDIPDMFEVQGIQPAIARCMGQRPENITGLESVFVNSDILGKEVGELVQMFDTQITDLNTILPGASPIMEMILALSTSDFATNFDKPHQIIIFSDMIQEMPDYSHRSIALADEEIDYDIWKENHGPVFGNLGGADWEIVYLQRETDRGIQTTEHQQFWIDFFTDLRAGTGRMLLR